ncbi:MAG: hypothetical protein AAB320_01175 [Elusimicrobiota bacterium]
MTARTLGVLSVALFLAAPRSTRAGEGIEALKASVFSLGLPPALRMAQPAPVPPELSARFQAAARVVRGLNDDIRWVKNDLGDMEERARRIISQRVYDPSFEGDLRRLSSDTTRRVEAVRRGAAELKALLGAAQRAPELNAIARDLKRGAGSLLSASWPGLEDASGRLEGTVRSGSPVVIGYDSQWLAADVSRGWRDFSTQARWMLSDAEALVRQTQP